jgi:alkane 1-monooxygenase
MLNAPTPAVPAWQDRKRYGWLISGLLPGLAWFNLVQYQASGQVVYLWLLALTMYTFIPLMDALLGQDLNNPPDSAVPGLEADRWYTAVLLLFVPLQLGLTVHGAWVFVNEPAGPLGVLGTIGLVLTVGGINGVAINTAHELGHKRPAWERWLSRIVLAPVAYGHFYIEHNRGHHRRVATPEDPASARLGESYWAFLPRTLVGGVRSAWALEADRLANRGLAAGRRAVPEPGEPPRGVAGVLDRLGASGLHWRNECLQAWAMTVLFFGALTAWLGWGVLPFLLIQAFYGASLLEVVNYIEHYGLLRQQDAQGRFERCAPEHSWNSSHRMSNLFLYHLQRHSDHHAHPARRYQALRHFAHAPQLPSGYAALLMLAYFPPLWFRLMDHRVLAHYGGELSRANVQPSRLAALKARWAPVQNP